MTQPDTYAYADGDVLYNETPGTPVSSRALLRLDGEWVDLYGDFAMDDDDVRQFTTAHPEIAYVLPGDNHYPDEP